MIINTSNNNIDKKHKERVEYLLTKQENFKLRKVSNLWLIGSSDINADRVYIFDKKTKREYSIHFYDKKYGYDYTVFERKSIPDDIYEKLIKSRPELRNIPKKDLAHTVEFDRGEVEIFIPKQKNMFKELIEKENLNDRMFNNITFYLAISTPDGIDNNIIQVVNQVKECEIITGLSVDDINSAVRHIRSLGYDGITLRINSPKIIVKDSETYLNELGYKVNRGIKQMKLSK
jgi:hypothetical protein